MILRNKRDNESWVRERTIDSMKANSYLVENNFVEVASNGYFYKIVTSVTDIPLEKEGLYAELQPFPKASKTEYGNIKVGNGLEVNDGVISHPEKHLPSDIATDENNRFVTDEQINNWNDKVSSGDFTEQLGNINTQIQDVNTKLNNKVEMSVFESELNKKVNTELFNEELNNKVDKDVFQGAIDDIVDKAIKGTTWKPPVNTFEDIATTYPDPKDTWTVITMDTNKIYMYNAETSKWEDYGQLVTPKMSFDNPNPSINEVGGIGRGTTFNDVPILDILHDMFYKKVDRNNVPEFYYGLVDSPTDFDVSKYTLKQFVKFPLTLDINDIQNKHVVFFFKPQMESGESIAPTDMFIQRISTEVQKLFGLDTPNIDLEQAFDFKSISIRGTSHIVISSKKILSGSYTFLLGRDKNRTALLTKSLLNKVNELESSIYRTKLKLEGGM